MVPRNDHIYKFTLEDTQQLMKLITGPTGEEKMEKNSAVVAALAQNPKLSVTIFTATVKKQNVPVV